MGLLYRDSFDHFDTASIGLKWQTLQTGGGNASFTIVSGIAGMTNNCLEVAGASNGLGGYAARNLPVNVTGTIFYGCDLFKPTLPGSGAWPTLALMDTGVPQIMLGVNAAGGLSIYNNPSAWGGITWLQEWTTGLTLLGSSVPGIIAAGVTNYVELVMLPSASVGTIAVYVNNILVLNLTGVNTASSGTAQVNQIAVAALAAANADFTYVDNLYVNDATTAYNNARIGPCIINAVFANAAGQLTQWVPIGAGANYQCVGTSTPQPDGDTTYNDASTTGLTDLLKTSYAFNYASIDSIQWVGCPRTNDGGAGGITPMWGNGTSTAAGTAINSVPEGYSFLLQGSAINPLTTNPWLPSDLPNLQVGYNRSA